MAVGLGHFARRFRAAAWLGWQVESNWTDPFLFILYALAKPLASGLILLVMYLVVVGGQTGDTRFAWMFVGNAFFTFVPLLLVGVGWTVVEDREMYQMLKYVFVAPIGLFTYLAGRSLTKLGLSVLACSVLLVFGTVVLNLRYEIGWPQLTYACLAFPLGVIGVFSVGLILAGLGLVFARHSVDLNEGAAAVLYLFCGAIFPVDLLPPVARELGLALPITWWLEAMRHVFGVAGGDGVIASLSSMQVLAGLTGLTALWYLGGATIYRLLARRAKRLGLLDQTTAF